MKDKQEKHASFSGLTGFHRAVPIILVAVALFIGLCFITQDIGAFGHAISSVLRGLFSYGAYIVPFLIAIHAIFYPADLKGKRWLSRLIFSLLTVTVISSVCYTFTLIEGEPAFTPGLFYIQGTEGVGGGFIGGVVAYGLIKIFGKIGTLIIAMAIVAIYAVYFFSGSKKVLGKILFAILKGIVFLFMMIEKGFKALFSLFARRKEERTKKETEERQDVLTEDEFFDVDNGLGQLSIPELGISETRTGGTDLPPTLQESVHHRSEVDGGDNTSKTTENTPIYIEPRVVNLDFEIDSEDGVATPTEEEKIETDAGALIGESSADSIFTANFDPYAMSMSEELVNKPSSRSLIDEKPSVIEEISEVSEEDIERERRRQAFEERKAQIAENYARQKEIPVSNSGEYTGTTKTLDISESESVSVSDTPETSGETSFVIEKTEPVAPVIVEPVVVDIPTLSDYTPSSHIHHQATPVPSASENKTEAEEYHTPTSAEVIGGDTGANGTAYTDTYREQNGNTTVTPTRTSGESTYRRAASFTVASMNDETETSSAKNTHTPLNVPVYTQPANTPPVQNSYGQGGQNYTPVSEQTVTRIDNQAPVYTTESAPAYGIEPTPVYTIESTTVPSVQNRYDQNGYTETRPTSTTEQFSAPTEEQKNESDISSFVVNTATQDEDGGRVWHSHSENFAEPKTDENDSYEEEGGLVFEVDMERQIGLGKVDTPSTLRTERTMLSNIDDEEEFDEEIDLSEVDDGVPNTEEIPPEKQNPDVIGMRDMFPALRDKEDIPTAEEVPKTVRISEPTYTYKDEEDEGVYSAVDNSDEDDVSGEEDVPFDGGKAVVADKPKKEPVKKTKPNFTKYKAPPLDLLLMDNTRNDEEIALEIQENTRIIIETLASFNVTASIKCVDRGPRITRYEVVPAKGVKVTQITNLYGDIVMNLAADGIRMEAPIPGKSAIGFEVPNAHPETVRLRELLECDEFQNAKSNTLACIGKDVAGNPVFGDISKFPHALIAGATGMGKSVSINAILISILYKARPDQVKLILIDPKRVEFRVYSGIPHLLVPVVTEAKQAAGALMWAVEEMERRYDLIEKLNLRNINAYNEKVAQDPSVGEPMSKIIIVIDELNDLMMQVRDPCEDLIMRIAQKARAAGIHLIIGTQRPDVKVITGTIKANINTRMSCKVTSVQDSRTILDMAGAEKLLDKGDMLYKPVDKPKPIRVQSAFTTDAEVEAVMEYLKSQAVEGQYDEEVLAEINRAAQKCGNKKNGGQGADEDDDDDDVGLYSDQKFLDAVEVAIRMGKVSTSLLQRKLSIGYSRAAKYLDSMEAIGVVSEPNGQKPRDVLMSMDEWHEKLYRIGADE